MPIRHCQKCGLKVLIDESQAGANPFYCQRCTTAMKGSDAAGDDLLSAAAAPPPSLKRTPVPAPDAVGSASPPKSATVKVLCPYCKASFNGRIPQKPARGSCPVCQKELILLPNGDIRPSAGFDLNQWQSEGARPAAKESGTKVLVRKFAADAAPAAAKKDGGTKVLARKAPAPPPPPPPAPEPLTVPADETADDESAALPSWLDDSSSEKKSSRPPVEDAPLPAPETDEAVRLDDLPPAGPPIEEEPPPPARLPPAAIAAPPPPPPPPRLQPSTARKSGAPAAGRRMTERRVTPAGAPAPTGAGKFMFALFLAALPVVACGVLLGVKEKLKGTVVEQIGQRFSKGFMELHHRLSEPPAKPAPPPEAPKPAPKPEEPTKPDAVEQARDENEILKLHSDYRLAERKLNELSVGATAEQKVEIEKARAVQKEREQKLNLLVERYKKIYGKEYDPRKQ